MQREEPENAIPQEALESPDGEPRADLTDAQWSALVDRPNSLCTASPVAYP